MSTKISLAWGDGFHLFRELFDEDRVHLELRGVDFQANPGAVEVAIPIAVWEQIRRVGVTTSDPIEKTDADPEAIARRWDEIEP